MKYHVGLSITKAVGDGIDVCWELRTAYEECQHVSDTANILTSGNPMYNHL